MKIKGIEIYNYRCFESFDTDLQPNLSVIVGSNGSGKSSVLDAIACTLDKIALIESPDRRDLGPSLQPSDMLKSKPSLIGTKQGGYLMVALEMVNFYKPEGWQHESIKLTQLRGRGPSQPIVPEPKHDNIEAYLDLINMEVWSDGLVPRPVFAYYRATRRSVTISGFQNVFTLKPTPAMAYDGAGDAGADFKSFVEWFYRRDIAELRSKSNGNGSDVFADLSSVRRALELTVDNVSKVYFEDEPMRLMFRTDAGDFELDQLSDGYRNMVAIVMDFARRLALANPNWPNPLEAPGILLIDEIELHLHPKWQQRVIPDLQRAFPNTQIIVTTHSPAVLTTVKRENIILLGSDHQIEEIPEDVGTYGAETSKVLAEVFGTTSRPESTETPRIIRDYLRLIEDGKEDTQEALDKRAKIEEFLGSSDPILQKADMRIRQLKFLANK